MDRGGRARSGAGAAIVGDPDQVRATLGELTEAGVESFILSGYPHLAECDLFARHVFDRMEPRSAAGAHPTGRTVLVAAPTVVAGPSALAGP